MNEHGEVSVTVEGIVVRSRPRFSSNTEAIDRNWKLITAAASELDRWILWADAESNFALTPDSLERVITVTKKLKDLGCVGFAMTLSSPMIVFYSEKIAEKIPIPFLASESVPEIRKFITTLIANS